MMSILLGSDNTAKDIERMMEWPDMRKQIKRAVNAHDELIQVAIEARAHIISGQKLSEQDVYIANLLDNAITKAKTDSNVY